MFAQDLGALGRFEVEGLVLRDDLLLPSASPLEGGGACVPPRVAARPPRPVTARSLRAAGIGAIIR